MMRPKKSVNELEEALRESTPPATAVPPHFRQQLRHDLQAQTAADKPQPLARGWLLAPVAVLVLVIVAFWYSVPKTAVEPALEINTTRPASTPTPSSTALNREEILQAAVAFASRRDNKPIGGWLVEPRADAITATAAFLETYDVALNRLGSFAVADFHGSNIIFLEKETETVWFVQLIGRWQPFGETADMIEPSRYVAVLVNPDTGQIVGAGSSTVPFVREPIVLALADYPPQARPYRVEQGSGFWLVHTGSQLLAFDPRAPYGPDLWSSGQRPERCLVAWEELNGRFTDPCSGDEWELDGTLYLPASTELWSDRNLDQYRLELDGGSILVHLDEIIFSDAIDLEALGTLEQPQTEFDTVIERPSKLAERRQAFLTSQTGWLYISTEEYVPFVNTGVDGKGHLLFPTAQMMMEDWYHVVKDGRYDQQITRYFDADNNLTQVIVFTNGHQMNLTVNQLLQASNEYLNLTNKAEYIAEQLQNSSNPDARNVKAYVFFENGRNLYLLNNTYQLDIDPDLANSQESIPDAIEFTYVFDLDTGRLLSEEIVYTTPDGGRITDSSIHYLTEEWITKLPEEAAELLDQGEAMFNDPVYYLDDGLPTPPPTPDS